MADWRLNGQHKYLNNIKLKHIEFQNKSVASDHEHCEFCMDKFGSEKGMLKKGYCTENEYHWICEKCYNDFKDYFNWTIVK
ncbi:MAG: hypothetical protein LIO69_02890 [Oscillospiraceae bacterium]|nr:hypothetical protein [Oscillospiraceae bacterium]